LAGESGWLAELVTVARAEALLASGEVQRCLTVLTPMPVRANAAASVLAASARRRIGDLRGARAVLGKVVADLEGEPLGLQIHAWLLESQLADERGDLDRASALLNRAVRAATSEQLRRPLLQDWRWIRGRVDRDPALLRSHRDFVSTCQVEGAAAPRSRTSPAKPDALSGELLTDREGQVLDLLAQMYSTEEIAAALYVSSNTVKTHLKGIFGKLCVNRRADAVRRGRQLGLC
jgi:LuxR family maltose regulon positive regulatory protein